MSFGIFFSILKHCPFRGSDVLMFSVVNVLPFMLFSVDFTEVQLCMRVVTVALDGSPTPAQGSQLALSTRPLPH